MYESVDWFKLVFCRKMELKWNYTSLEMLREEDGQAWNQTEAEKWKKKTKVQQPGTVRTVHPCARLEDSIRSRGHGLRARSNRAHGRAVFISCELTHFLLFLGIEGQTTSGEVIRDNFDREWKGILGRKTK